MTLAEVSQGITKPTVLLNEQKTRQHIVSMSRKIGAQARLRPHFKTHQSAEIGRWFREQGVDAISVSSVTMATYFADNGWDDILITLPVNIRELPLISQLAHRVTLHVLVETDEAVAALASIPDTPLNVWIEVDTGSNRTGIHWQDTIELSNIATTITKTSHLSLAGLLTYAGKTYTARSRQEVTTIYHEALDHLVQVRKEVNIGRDLQLSIGDTPSCSIVDSFGDADELRPGNFVFYDLMQAQIGACSVEDIAIGVACPIIAKYEDDYRVVTYGGATHFSKDAVLIDNEHVYGQLALLKEDGWAPIPNGRLVKMSQEHGVVTVDSDTFNALQVGQLIVILPAHACLTADLYDHYLTFEGRMIPKIRTND